MAMHMGSFIAEVTCLSPKATEKDIYDFFTHCGSVENVEIIRSGTNACTAYVTFIDAYAFETALLLTGAKIGDQFIHIAPWGMYLAEPEPWGGSSLNSERDSASTTYHVNHSMYIPAEAVTKAQEVVVTMLSKGYVLGKDALFKAKTLDESTGVTAMATARLADLSRRIGLTDTINSSMETVKFVDERFHVSGITRSAAFVTGTAAVAFASVTGRAAMAAGTAVVGSEYFAKGALWLSDVFHRAAKAASEINTHAPE